LSVKAKKYSIDVDRLQVTSKARNDFKGKKPLKTTNPETNYMLVISLVYITIICLLFFPLVKKENEGISFLAEM